MNGVLLAGGTVLFELQTVGIVALILEAVVISVFALRAFECNLHSCRFNSHRYENSIQKNYTPFGA